MTGLGHDDLTEYLVRTGWRHGEPGPYGSLWALGDADPVGITHSLDSTSPDWGLTLDRLGLVLGIDGAAVERRIANAFVDEIAFKVPATDQEIPLSVGVALFAWARRAVRTSAIASNRPRAVIDYAPVAAQRVIGQVTVGHTRPGSYVVPIRYPLDRVLTDDAKSVEAPRQDALDGAWDENRESPQRRASRTLMQALGRLEQEVLRPDRIPRDDALRALIPSGVTYDLVSAVRAMVVTEEVEEFRTVATWATAAKAPAQTPDEVVVRREAAEVLRVTAEKLSSMKPVPRGEYIAGPLVTLDTHGAGPDRSAGIRATVGIQVFRNGRQSTVDVDTEPEIWRDVAHWLKTGESVTAFGVVEPRSRGLVLRRQGALGPVGQAALPGM